MTINSSITYESIFTSTGGCDSIITTTVTAILPPVSAFSYSPESPSAVNEQIDFINESEAGSTYLWTITTPDGSSTTYTTSDATWSIPTDLYGTVSVCLEVTNSAGCISENCETITFEEDVSVYIPNSFTPNGDGMNEFFYPVIDGTAPQEYLFMIFNRWGELIYESEVYGERWDGTYKSTLVQTDTYVYRLTFKNGASSGKKEYRGHVNLLK